MITINALKVPRHIDEDAMNVLLSFVSPEKRARIARFVRVEDAYRSLLGDLLLRLFLVSRTGLDNREIAFALNPFGKPYLRQASPEAVSFNLSHSGDWVVTAGCSGRRDLGIDVESAAPLDMKIAEGCFSQAENDLLRAAPEDERLELFYRLWTLKESYIKAIGQGFSLPLASFSMTPTPGGEWACPEAERFCFRSWKLDERHFIAVSADTAEIPRSAEVVAYETLLAYFQQRS